MSFFVVLPIKRTINRGVKKGSGTDTDQSLPSPADLTTLEQQRQKVLGRFEGLKAVLEGPVTTESAWKAFATTAMRDALLTEIEADCKEYIRLLLDSVTSHKGLAGHYFYFWGSSFTDKQNKAFDDYRYEVSCMYYNLGAVLANVARFVGRPSVSPNSIELACKECYGLLCKSASYLALAKQAMEHMSATPAMSSKEELIEDAKATFLDVLLNAVLGEAQEMGLQKALLGNALGEVKSPLLPKKRSGRFSCLTRRWINFRIKSLLAHRDALCVVQCCLGTTTEKVVAQAQALLYHASCRYETEPKEGLWFLAQHRGRCTVADSVSKTLEVPCLLKLGVDHSAEELHEADRIEDQLVGVMSQSSGGSV